jgi:hypothetical protein
MSVDVNLAHLHETIRTLCGRGWWVFPLAPGKKTPITPNGYKDATSNTAAALSQFNYGKLNIGVATGPSRLTVLDVDGVPGLKWLFETRATLSLPKTFTVRTRSGGFHYYFLAPACRLITCSASKIAPGVDIRAEGGHVVGPSSWVAADHKGPAGWYRVTDDSPVAPLPDWLLTAILAGKKNTTKSRSTKKACAKSVSPETPRAVATLKEVLKHIDADCDYETYRNVIWAVMSTGWRCAEQVALDWSLTAPERFEQTTFEALINTYDPDRPDCISYGTLVFLARQGGYRG